MKAVLCALAIAVTLWSCDKAENSSINLDGPYIGIFSRTGMDTSKVTLTFKGNDFSGHADRVNYPAVCKGEFLLDNSTIIFHDSCAWTANFDWSLILDGKYNISADEGTIRIWKTNGAVTDEYLLKRPVR